MSCRGFIVKRYEKNALYKNENKKCVNLCTGRESGNKQYKEGHMERVEYILSLVGTVLSFLVALLTLVLKLMKVLKDKSITEDREKLVEKLLELVVEAEEMLDYSGKEKKAYVMEKISEFASETDIEADLEFVSEEIEKLVELSKQVNAREG